MKLHGLKVNGKISYFHKTYTIMSIDPPNIILKRDDTDGEAISISFHELVTNPSFKPNSALLKTIDKSQKEYFSLLDGLSQKKREEVTRRFEIIRPLIIIEKAKNGSIPAWVELTEFYNYLLNDKDLQTLTQKELIERISEYKGGSPSKASIKRYLKYYRDAEISMLIKPEEGLISHAGDGHKYRSDNNVIVLCHPKDPSVVLCTLFTRMESEVAVIIKEVLEKEYLTIHKPNKSATWRSLEAKCTLKKLEPPEKSTFLKLINRIPINIQEMMRGTAKDRQKYIDVQRNGGTGQALYPLHIIEIDHTELDIVVLDEKSGHTIGRPWITVGIDVYSRTIWCLYISIQSPSANRTRKALENGILLKRVKENYHTLNEWPVFGIPSLIKLDNGSDFTSNAIKRVIEETIKSHVRFRPRGTPSYGGTIERFFGTLNTEVIQTLHGTTKSNVKELGEYDSEEEAALTLVDLKEIIIRWITDVYHYKEHEGLPIDSNTPLVRFYEGINEVGYPDFILEEDEEEFKIELLPSMLKPYTRDGIRLGNVIYKHPSLTKLIGPRGLKYKIKYDDDDISKIYIFLGEENRYQEMLADLPSFETLKGVNRYTYKKVLDNLRNEGKIKANSLPGTGLVKQALASIKEDIEKKYKKSRRARKEAAKMGVEVNVQPYFNSKANTTDEDYQQLLNNARRAKERGAKI